jgi:GntR family transcriptional regulator/MocR family aminotransferase
MAKTWATFGADLHLEVCGTRVRAAVEQALRDAVQGGRLRPGTRMPPTRTLARDLGVARNTVAEAYAQLVAEGWLVARSGSGSWVSERAASRRARGRARPEAHQFRFDLSPGSSDASSFPRAAWQAATRRALAAAPYDVFGYSDPRGLPQLRRELADYLSRTRGVRTTSEQVVVCSGFAQGLALVCRTLHSRGVRTLAIEEDGHRLHHEIVTAAGLRTRPVPIDAAGAEVERFGDAGAALLSPAHQYPHGVPLDPARRTAAVRWAAQRGAFLVEDDYDGEFRYDRQAVGALQALAPERVVYTGTVSKTLAPGVRLGWLVVPDRLLDDVLAAKRLTAGQHGTLDQLAFAEFLRSGGYDRHVRSRRLVYRRRREQLVAALARHAPATRIHGVAAGLQTVVELPPGTDEADVIARARERGLAVGGLREHHLTRRPTPYPALVVSFGTPPDHAFSSAVARLCAVLAEVKPGRPAAAG